MGGMMGNTARKIQRARARKRFKDSTKVEGTCSFKNCNERVRAELHCRTCDALHDEKPKKPRFSVKTCREHSEWATAKIKKHTLARHPSNLARATLHALKGGTFE